MISMPQISMADWKAPCPKINATTLLPLRSIELPNPTRQISRCSANNIKSPRVILDAENSRLLTQQLIAELAALTDTEALTAWAGEILPRKNQLIISDAEALENAFAAKLSEIGADASIGNTEGEITGKRANARLNDARDRQRGTNNNAVPARAIPGRSVTPIGRTLRLRD